MKKIITIAVLSVLLLAGSQNVVQAADVTDVQGAYEQYLPVKKGMCFQVGNGIYQVISATEGKRSVRYLNPADKNCTKAIVPSSITLPVDGNSYQVTTIGADAFKNCVKLTTVRIGNQVKNIGTEAFSGCTKLAKAELPANVTYLGEKAFANCTSLKTVTIGNKLKKLNKGIFYKCTSLKTVKIGTGITNIGERAFSGCKNLKSVTIRTKSLKTVGKNAFYGINEKAEVKVPASKLTAYKKLLAKKGMKNTATIKKL